MVGEQHVSPEQLTASKAHKVAEHLDRFIGAKEKVPQAAPLQDAVVNKQFSEDEVDAKMQGNKEKWVKAAKIGGGAAAVITTLAGIYLLVRHHDTIGAYISKNVPPIPGRIAGGVTSFKDTITENAIATGEKIAQGATVVGEKIAQGAAAAGEKIAPVLDSVQKQQIRLEANLFHLPYPKLKIDKMIKGGINMGQAIAGMPSSLE
jgi:hypothetical protein